MTSILLQKCGVCGEQYDELAMACPKCDAKNHSPLRQALTYRLARWLLIPLVLSVPWALLVTLPVLLAMRVVAPIGIVIAIVLSVLAFGALFSKIVVLIADAITRPLFGFDLVVYVESWSMFRGIVKVIGDAMTWLGTSSRALVELLMVGLSLLAFAVLFVALRALVVTFPRWLESRYGKALEKRYDHGAGALPFFTFVPGKWSAFLYDKLAWLIWLGCPIVTSVLRENGRWSELVSGAGSVIHTQCKAELRAGLRSALLGSYKARTSGRIGTIFRAAEHFDQLEVLERDGSLAKHLCSIRDGDGLSSGYVAGSILDSVNSVYHFGGYFEEPRRLVHKAINESKENSHISDRTRRELVAAGVMMEEPLLSFAHPAYLRESELLLVAQYLAAVLTLFVLASWLVPLA